MLSILFRKPPNLIYRKTVVTYLTVNKNLFVVRIINYKNVSLSPLITIKDIQQ